MIKDLRPGTEVKLSKLTKDTHETKPPTRFSENAVIAKLESLGVGRPSTYSSIVSLIQDRGYVAKKGTQLYPTPLGFAVARLLAAKFPSFTAYEYTAHMEASLDEIIEGKQSRVPFLKDFWRGKDGFEAVLKELTENIDFSELEQYSTIELYNGYSIRFSKFGTFLQDERAELDENGYKRSVRLSDDIDVWDYREAEACEAAFEAFANKKGPRKLGTLKAGEYRGWDVWAREGKFGAYVQAIHPDQVKAEEAGKKPGASVPKAVNQKLLEEETLDELTLESVADRFQEVKLPRWSPDGKWLVGVGKRGVYVGYKASPRGRPIFRSPKSEIDPKTVSFDDVKKLWEEAAPKPKSVSKGKAPAKAPAAKKPPAKRAAPKKPAVKKGN